MDTILNNIQHGELNNEIDNKKINEIDKSSKIRLFGINYFRKWH